MGRYAWIVLLFVVVGCDAERAASLEVPWRAVVTSSQRVPGAEPARACNAGACQPVGAGALLTAPVHLETGRGGELGVRVGSSLEVALASSSAVELGDGRALRLVSGSIELHAGDGASDDVVLEAGSHGLRLGHDARVALEARGGRAVVTVRAGSVRVGDVELAQGETASLTPGAPPDRLAVYRGEVAPVAASVGGDATDPSARGLGSMSARVPGTQEIVGGVRLTSHHVRVAVRDGFARTEIVEEFHNDTGRVLEGRLIFPLPADASISRLALWVNDKLVEGELLERQRAAALFRGIVDDTVRPRDPALLEWLRGSEFSLKIFPLPAHGSRRVLLAYNQALPRAGGRWHYRYPLSLGRERATAIDEFSIEVDVADSRAHPIDVEPESHPATVARGEDAARIAWKARDFVPERDFALSWRLDAPVDEAPAIYRPATALASERLVERSAAEREPGFVAVRMRVEPPATLTQLPEPPSERAFVLDASHSQSAESFATMSQLVLGLIAPSERFVLLSCDSACVSYPERGLAQGEGAIADARAWLSRQRPAGASDLAGSLTAAIARLYATSRPQIVYLGDGAATAGELDAEAIAARLDRLGGIDLRLLGTGRSVDEVLLRELARRTGAGYTRVSTGASLGERVEQLAATLRAPLLRGATLSASEGLLDLQPAELPSLALGDEIVVTAKLADGNSARLALAGELAGQPYRLERTLKLDGGGAQNALVPRLWAEAKIAALDAAREQTAVKASVELSQRYHVMSRHTALLVLENERMFREFGIERTQRTDDAGDTAASGHMWGESIGDKFGAGGLGLSGVGAGGGGEGIGMGFGEGHGRLGRSHQASAPRVRMGSTSVSGRLPPEVIQRIVRQNFGRFRACYQAGLTKNPGLEGRVVVRFVIGRDGSVTSSSAGGDLPDADVVSCVGRAFQGLSFPQPEGGIVTVSYPIVFSTDGSVPNSKGPPVRDMPSPPWRPPSFAAPPPIAHQAADERWREASHPFLDDLRRKLDERPDSRSAHERFTRALLRLGRFEQARAAAERFVALDPDAPAAHELAAYAAAALGDGATAVRELSARIELEPRSQSQQLRVALAHEAIGDDARACAHWRAAASLLAAAARDKAAACLGRELAPSEQRMAASPAKSSFPAPWLEARVSCATEGCPTVAVVDPNGRVYSPWTPAAVTSVGVGVEQRMSGIYRTLLLGGEAGVRGEVVLAAEGQRGQFRFERRGGPVQTVAATHVQQRFW